MKHKIRYVKYEILEMEFFYYLFKATFAYRKKLLIL